MACNCRILNTPTITAGRPHPNAHGVRDPSVVVVVVDERGAEIHREPVFPKRSRRYCDRRAKRKTLDPHRRALKIWRKSASPGFVAQASSVDQSVPPALHAWPPLKMGVGLPEPACR